MQGDRTFERLALPHRDAAYGLARWLCGNPQDAEDVTQEALARAFRFFDGYRGGDVRAWLLRIVRNTCYSRWRVERRRAAPVAFEEEEHSHAALEGADAAVGDPEAACLRAEHGRLLDRALASLPRDFRDALVLRELEELSYKEIAASLGIPVGTVMSRLARARPRLRSAYLRLAGEEAH